MCLLYNGVLIYWGSFPYKLFTVVIGLKNFVLDRDLSYIGVHNVEVSL